MIGALIHFLILLALFVLLVRPDIGLCLYLVCYFLLPSLDLDFIGLDATDTSILFAVFFLMANIRNIRRINKIDYTPIIPFVVLYCVLFLLTFFSSQQAPLGFAMKYFLRYIIQIFVIPICIYMMITCNPGILRRVNLTMILVITVSVVYGLFLTLMPGVNPYIDVLQNEIHLQEIHLGSAEGRMFGAISSVYMHPMSFGVMLGFSFCYVIYLKENVGISHLYFSVLVIMILMNTLFCGVRSSLAALMGTCLVYLLMKRKFSLVVYASLIMVFVMVVLSHIPMLRNYVNSLFLMESDAVRGSSINLRLDQLMASLLEIKENPYFGNGYAWHSYYIWSHGGYGHPLLHGWESLLFVTLTDSGYVGVFVWIVFVIFFCRKIRDIGVICLFSYFMLYRIFTGTFGENFFYIFYVLFLCIRRIKILKTTYY